MKKRIITLVLSALAVVLLVGVGFASWVVSQGEVSKQTGNILVETVVDGHLNVEVTPEDKRIQFGAPQNASTGWLYEDGENAVLENLSVKFTVTVTDLKPGQAERLSLTNTFGEKLLNASNEEVDMPTQLFLLDEVTYGANEANDDTLWSVSGTTATTTVVVTLTWGSLFEGKNPYEFFNAEEVEEKLQDGEGQALAVVAEAVAAGLTITKDNTWAELALAALAKVYEYNDHKFQLTIKINA